MLFFRTPNFKRLEWDSIKNSVLLCEKLGYDSLFIADHLFLGNDGDIYEALTTMSALGALTEKMTIIPIHLCNNFRHPGLVAKSICTMSHITNGRIELFYDYGWRKSEFDCYGINFCNDENERISMMSEGIEIIKGLLQSEKFSYDGKYYKMTNSICNPKPIKNVPIWMGETNNHNMVEQIVKHSDVFNSMPCSLDDFKEKCNVIKDECTIQDRDFSDIKLSLETQVLIRETEEEIEAELEKYSKMKLLNNSYDEDILEQLALTNPNGVDYSSTDSIKEQFIVGTPKQVRQKVKSFINAGVNHFMIWFMDFPDTKGMELFSKEVMNSVNKTGEFTQ